MPSILVTSMLNRFSVASGWPGHIEWLGLGAEVNFATIGIEPFNMDPEFMKIQTP